MKRKNLDDKTREKVVLAIRALEWMYDLGPALTDEQLDELRENFGADSSNVGLDDLAVLVINRELLCR
jgi:hypothetical protein